MFHNGITSSPPSEPSLPPPSPLHRRTRKRETSSRESADGERQPRGNQRWMADGKQDRPWADVLRAAQDRVDYLTYAQMDKVTAANWQTALPPLRPHTARRGHPPADPMSTDDSSSPPTGDAELISTARRDATNTRRMAPVSTRRTVADRRTFTSTNSPNNNKQHHPLRNPNLNLPPPNFTPEDQAYLRARLPLRQPASAQTAADHFRRLPLAYGDLAEGCRARLADGPRGGREWERRRRMAALAQRLAERYRGFGLALPPARVDGAIARWRAEQLRESRFWEKVLDEVEEANKAWSAARLWVLLFVIQSALVARALSSLATPEQLVQQLVANALAYTWSTTVTCEMLHARYVDAKAEEQELHDLLGGLRG